MRGLIQITMMDLDLDHTMSDLTNHVLPCLDHNGGPAIHVSLLVDKSFAGGLLPRHALWANIPAVLCMEHARLMKCLKYGLIAWVVSVAWVSVAWVVSAVTL